jgi:hypothetical protein
MRTLLVLFTVLVPMSGIPSVAAQDNMVTYESPTYGFSVTWDDDVWDLDEDATLVASGLFVADEIRLVAAGSPALYILGADNSDTDAASCVSAESNRVESDATISEYRPYVRADGTELAGDGEGVAFAAFRYLRTLEARDPYEAAVYINCQILPGSGISVVFLLYAETTLFEPYLVETERVMATLQLPAPTPEPTPTAEPEVTSVDAAWFEAQVAAATAEPSDAGPLAGELVVDPERRSFVQVAADEQDFYLRAAFESPSAFVDLPWQFGVEFRFSSIDDNHLLIIDSDGTWVHIPAATIFTTDFGEVPSLATAAGATNTLELVVLGDTGAFRLNGGELVGPLDLSATSGAGLVSIGVGFYETSLPGAVTAYSDVELWSIEGEAPAE